MGWLKKVKKRIIMKLTLKETTATIVEVELPAYYHWGGDSYKILNETTAIIVTDYDFTYGIRRCELQKNLLGSAVKSGKRITEQEFLDAFHRVGEKVKRELIKAIETDGWKAQEQAELKANALAEVETTQS
jgi:hypothetical protein